MTGTPTQRTSVSAGGRRAVPAAVARCRSSAGLLPKTHETRFRSGEQREMHATASATTGSSQSSAARHPSRTAKKRPQFRAFLEIGRNSTLPLRGRLEAPVREGNGDEPPATRMALLDRDRFCQVARFVHVGAAHERDVIRQQLQRHHVQQR